MFVCMVYLLGQKGICWYTVHGSGTWRHQNRCVLSCMKCDINREWKQEVFEMGRMWGSAGVLYTVRGHDVVRIPVSCLVLYEV